MRWDEIDLTKGTFATRRNKTDVPRIAVLFKETIKAIKDLPRDKPTVFNTARSAYARRTVHKRFKQYREAAKVPADVATFAMIRDFSFSTAAKVNMDHARALAGHRFSGAVDNYVMRSPQLVADVCTAIHAELFPKSKQK